MRNFLILFISVFFFNTNLKGQQISPLNKNIIQRIDKQINNKNINVHSSFKPLIDLNINNNTLNLDSILFFKKKTQKKISYFQRKLKYDNFIKIDTTGFFLTIDPLFNFELGREFNQNNNLYINTRGIIAKGFIGDKLYFQTSFYENQAKFSEYISSFINTYNIAPGQGLVKNFGEGGFDFASATGLISYSPNKTFNFQFGHGKNFIGDGYRSLLLSDNSFNYPFFKITTNVWKFQYTNLYAQFIDLNEEHTYESGYPRKFGSFHFLSINLSKSLQLGLFEAVIWQNADSTGTRGFDINYLNPIIFYHPVQFSLGSPDNSLIGLNLKWRTSNQIQLYGQLVLDDFNIGQLKNGKGFFQNKFGYQIGIKYFDIFSIPNLYFQTEYNQVQPYTFAHKTPMQNYSHYNQAIAHPLGANFKESVSIINFRKKNWFLENQFNYAIYGTDTADTHWGKNIFMSDYDAEMGMTSFNNENGQGLKTYLVFNNFSFSYLLNPKTNMSITLGMIYRKLENDIEKKETQYVYFSFKTSLRNLYYDF